VKILNPPPPIPRSVDKSLGRISIHYAVDYRKSNIEFDAVPLRLILTKCRMLTKYCACAKRTRTIWCKNLPTLHRYRDLRVGVF